MIHILVKDAGDRNEGVLKMNYLLLVEKNTG